MTNELYHYNHNHDPRTGKFTSRNGVAAAQGRIDKLSTRKKKIQNDNDLRNIKIQANEAILNRPSSARAAAKYAKYDRKLSKVKSKGRYRRAAMRSATNDRLNTPQTMAMRKSIKLESKMAKADKKRLKAEQRISKQESKIARNNAKIQRIDSKLRKAETKLVRAKISEVPDKQLKVGKAEVDALMKVYSENLKAKGDKAALRSPSKAQSLYNLSEDKAYLRDTARSTIEQWIEEEKKNRKKAYENPYYSV